MVSISFLTKRGNTRLDRIAGWKLFPATLAPSSKEGDHRAATLQAQEKVPFLEARDLRERSGPFARTKAALNGFVNLQASEWSPFRGRHRGSLSAVLLRPSD
jgi:hypothetical protein